MQTLAISVRIASDADLPGIVFADPLSRADHDRGRLIRSSVAVGECLVAIDGDEVLGYAILNSSFFGHAFVPLLVVAMANRRAGVGNHLLAEAERRCKGDKLFTSTNESNMPAQWLLEKRGYLPSGRVANLDVNDDELVFCKRLVHRA